MRGNTESMDGSVDDVSYDGGLADPDVVFNGVNAGGVEGVVHWRVVPGAIDLPWLFACNPAYDSVVKASQGTKHTVVKYPGFGGIQ